MASITSTMSSSSQGILLDSYNKAFEAASGSVYMLAGTFSVVILYFAVSFLYLVKSSPLLMLFKIFAFVYIFAPLPRLPYPSELAYQTVKEDGTIVSKIAPCWHDRWLVNQEKIDGLGRKDNSVDAAEVLVTMVVPAYNEQERLLQMMEEAVDFLESKYSIQKTNGTTNTSLTKRNPPQNGNTTTTEGAAILATSPMSGWELLIISDGSTDKTTSVALNYAKSLSKTYSGNIRVISLTRNRGKGGAVTHGMRHARGSYIGFADADGASKFADLEKLIEACQGAEDKRGRAFAVGSRAHLVGSETVQVIFTRGHAVHCAAYA
jgi:dolichyl-phosphate beta-glucosyltransferase